MELEQRDDIVQELRTVGRPEADFLVELHRRVQHPTPPFERLFYRAIRDHVLTDGRVGAGEAVWLRQVMFADGTLKDEVRTFLHELNGEASYRNCEYEALLAEAMRVARERRTSR